MKGKEIMVWRGKKVIIGRENSSPETIDQINRQLSFNKLGSVSDCDRALIVFAKAKNQEEKLQYNKQKISNIFSASINISRIIY